MTKVAWGRIALAAATLLATCSGSVPALEGQSISYVESSVGLEIPGLEKGYTEIEMGDVDGDGNIDLISVGDHGSPNIGTTEHGVMVWFGDGHGGWSVFQYGGFGYGGIALGDVNGDSLVDVGYGIHHNYSSNDLGDQILEVALGDGSGRSWVAWDDGLASNGEDYGMFGSDFADVDGDGRLDLGSISFGCCSGVHVYLNQGDGSWIQSFGFTGGNAREEIAFGDVNGDGWMDFAVSHDAGTVYVGDGRGGFSPGDEGLPAMGLFGRAGIALGDVNGDGRDDLAWINGGGGPEIWTRSVDGTWSDFGGSLPATGPWEAAQLSDMDGDGTVDLVAFGGGEVDVFKGDGAGGWTVLTSLHTPTPGGYAAFRVGGDADHNGYPDIALVSEEGSLYTYRNHLRFYKEASPPSTLRTRIVHPGSGSHLRTGTVRFVDWIAEVPDGAPGTVRLEFSRGGLAGPWHSIAEGIPNNGRHQWNVPDVAGTDDLRLRVVVTAGGQSVSAESGRPLRLSPGHDPLRISFADSSTLRWSDRMGRVEFDLYRGDWDRFLATGEYTQDPAVVAEAARWCLLAGMSRADPFEPLPDRLAFYLVTGVAAAMEGSLGMGRGEVERVNANPCP